MVGFPTLSTAFNRSFSWRERFNLGKPNQRFLDAAEGCVFEALVMRTVARMELPSTIVLAPLPGFTFPQQYVRGFNALRHFQQYFRMPAGDLKQYFCRASR